MAEKARCEICERNFKDEEGLAMHNSAKHSESKTEKKKAKKVNIKKIKSWVIWLVILGLVIWGISAMFSGIKVLPPTTMQGHVEQSPSSHIVREPMGLAIQKHMLEHADGTGRPGIIINYNCEDYFCEDGLIEKLEAFAIAYTENIYVAPFKDMDAKIVLTKLNRIEILEEYDQKKIEIFIGGTLSIKDNSFSTPISGEIVKDAEDSAEETGVKEFTMIAKQWKFIPNTITVSEGDLVKLAITSIDVAHGLYLPTFGVDEYLSPGNTVNLEFVANKKGTFSFFCNVSCGAGHSTMRGKIIVE